MGVWVYACMGVVEYARMKVWMSEVGSRTSGFMNRKKQKRLAHETHEMAQMDASAKGLLQTPEVRKQRSKDRKIKSYDIRR